jgi:hypothetical protein
MAATVMRGEYSAWGGVHLRGVLGLVVGLPLVDQDPAADRPRSIWSGLVSVLVAGRKTSIAYSARRGSVFSVEMIRWPGGFGLRR